MAANIRKMLQEMQTHLELEGNINGKLGKVLPVLYEDLGVKGGEDNVH